MLTSRHAISNSTTMFFSSVDLSVPSACLSLCSCQVCVASGSLLHPSLTWRVWEVLWFEQPPPQSLSVLTPLPHTSSPIKASSAQTLAGANPRNVSLQGCMRNTWPSQFSLTYCPDLERPCIFRNLPGARALLNWSDCGHFGGSHNVQMKGWNIAARTQNDRSTYGKSTEVTWSQLVQRLAH